ncbi:hypothetical protein DOTSEDRAFT_72970 [Dothistroma septosporum NZE10]|uniref:NmrA-like domain-containing protein n=1 Tax=Dothistroma septosporum (strain NZE10 / CBS 128990) TaxID=675120 RepID=N1PKG5_DOTSN|nr:hypothetical protein DOTSEDRAFT_72970 [Dothistroma septosporum NZE10]
MGSIEHGSTIRRILVLGDNRLSESIIHGISQQGLDVHHVTHSAPTEHEHSGVTIHKSDSTPGALKSLLLDVNPDLVFSTQASGSYDFQKQIIDSAIEADVKRFIPPEFSQDALNEQIQHRLPPVKERARTIQYLQEQSSNGKIEWVAIATGSSLEHAIISGNIGFDLQWQSATIHGTGKERFPASSTAWDGRAAAAVIERWDEVKNQYLYASGMTTDTNEILEQLQSTTGQKWEKGSMGVEDILHEAERRFERGFPDAGMFLMERSVLFDDKLDAVKPFVEKDAKQVLGLEAEGLESLIKKVIHDYKHHGKGGCGCD